MLSLSPSMKLNLQSGCQLAFLALCCTLITVRVSGSPFVPGRCLCPQMQNGVRGQLIDLSVLPKSHNCNRDTVIVTLKKNNERVCLNPEAPMGKQLMRCWKRATKLNRNVRLCLRRRRRTRGQQRPRQRNRAHKRRASSSN